MLEICFRYNKDAARSNYNHPMEDLGVVQQGQLY